MTSAPTSAHRPAAIHPRNPQRLRALGARAALAGMVCVIAAGCASSSGDGFARPDLPEKTGWSVPVAAGPDVGHDWWRRFGDPELDRLAERALEANLSLALMARRADLAEAQIGSARAALLPVFSVGGRTDSTSISGDFDLGTTNKQGLGGELYWELDVWGKARAGVRAQQAAYRASQADFQAARLALVSNVADTYFLVRRTDAQMAYQYRSVARARELVRLYILLAERGLTDRGTVVAQEAERNDAELVLTTLTTNRRKLVNGLATLIGAPAGEFELADTSDLNAIEPVVVPAGLPSDLLYRRPDILAAEERLKQSLSLETRSRLARLPNVGLTGLGGSASYGLSGLLKTWTAGLSGVVQFPVFDPGIRAGIRVADAQVEVAEEEYRVAVMQAFQEVEDALVALEGSRSQRVLLEENRAKRAYVARQETEKLKRGLVSRLSVLEAERSLDAAEQQLLANRWQVLADTVSLYKAIGGGWGAGERS
jgi:NodT family efflux transporter outer membrane factor (OMF) lipoprotein